MRFGRVRSQAIRTVSSFQYQKRATSPLPPGSAAAQATGAQVKTQASQDPPATMAAITTAAAHRAADLRIILVILAYAGSSLSGIFVNKACLSAYDFRYTITLMLSQLCVSVFALSILRLMKVVHIPERTWRDMIVLLFPAVSLILNVTVGLLALRLVNIPMFSAFRRLSVLNVMVLEYFVLGKTASRRIMWTVLIMVSGSFIAGLGDLTFDPLGYFLVFLNNFITAANLVSIKKASAVVRLEALALNYYVSCIALPIVFLLALVTGELTNAIADISIRPELQTPGFAVALSLSAASAFLVNFFTNLCTQLTSPLTTAITGQMKNVLQTVLGIFAWGYRVSALNLTGLGVALVGSLCFAYLKYTDAMSQRAANTTANGKEVMADDDDSVLIPLSSKGLHSGQTHGDVAMSSARTAPGDSSAYLAAYNEDSEAVSLLRQTGRATRLLG
jgi:solute carrier family 35